MEEAFLLNEKLYQNKNTLIYGTHEIPVKILNELLLYGVTIKAFITERQESHSSIPDLPIYALNDVCKEIVSGFYVIINIDSSEEGSLKKVCLLAPEMIFFHRGYYQSCVVFSSFENEGIPCEPVFIVNPQLTQQDIVIYGVGDIGRRLFMELLNLGVYVKWFCDSNPDYTGIKFMNKRILSINELEKVKDKCNVIIGSKDYYNEIKARLEKIGVKSLFKC